MLNASSGLPSPEIIVCECAHPAQQRLTERVIGGAKRNSKENQQTSSRVPQLAGEPGGGPHLPRRVNFADRRGSLCSDSFLLVALGRGEIQALSASMSSSSSRLFATVQSILESPRICRMP